MGLKSQFQIKMKQRHVRKNRRKRLLARGKDLNEYFYGKYYLKGGPEDKG